MHFLLLLHIQISTSVAFDYYYSAPPIAEYLGLLGSLSSYKKTSTAVRS